MSKLVFINDVDTFSSKNIAKFFATYEPSGDDFEDEDDEDTSNLNSSGPAYYVVGSVSSFRAEVKPSFLLQRYEAPNKDELLQILLGCDVVIYNISDPQTYFHVEQAMWAVTALHAKTDSFPSQKVFVLVASVMGWTATELGEQEESKLPTDEEFWRRRPHPKFRTQNVLEKLVIKLSKTKKAKLRCYVVSSGLQYGLEEEIFHYFFKVSWLMQMPKIPVFGEGTNALPTIHIYDLAAIIQKIIRSKPRCKYYLAVDDGKESLESIVKAISHILGPQKIEKVPLEEAITTQAYKAEELEYLTIDLLLEPVNVSAALNMTWKYQTGLVRNMRSVVQEFRECRHLLPIRICMLGPPGVGKTTVAKKVAAMYQIHLIDVERATEDRIAKLKETISKSGSDDAIMDEVDNAKRELESINKSLRTSPSQLNEQQTYEVLQEMMNSQQCKNQGFILDAIPESYNEAMMHFASDDQEGEDTDGMTKLPGYNKLITPEYVIVLNASDEFLTKRVAALAASEAVQKSYEEEKFAARLAKFRQDLEAEETVLDFFDHRELHPEFIEVEDDPDYKKAIKQITGIVGLPKNYMAKEEEQEKERQMKKEEEETKRKLAEEKRRNKEVELGRISIEHDEWLKNLDEVKRQDLQRLEACALPLRNYLMRFVVPSLTEAMSECCSIKPEDPVDFLAEYLLRLKRD